jgi:hypothetical protein
MNDRTSRRNFVALAAGALASLAAGLGRVFGQGAISPDSEFDAPACNPHADGSAVTYTYDEQARLLPVTGAQKGGSERGRES